MASTYSIPSEVQVLSSMNGETLRIANIGHVQNELRTIYDLAPHRVITLDLNAKHTAEALVEGSSACVWVGWDSETGHIT
ncbi:hypothetical protein N7519_004299 [Penicillium mononematosum]|uniref:uncharacterized protein n=1 Tax=Penicillium mononematosum TaxID=268346 RepID=UPI0025473073|nr:uncharacterized protein N7519_004299 [Penicillium mononematosum]KAJ6189391.1 hypothetical protein N7519_004299 [Penicillium mononematosum]